MLAFTGIRGSPRVLWRFQRYLPAAKSAGCIHWICGGNLHGAFTGIRGRPRVLWRFQRYLPAAGSAGLVTGSAGAACAGFYRDQRQPPRSCGDFSGVCLRLGLLVCFHRKQTTGLKCKAFGFEG